MRLPIVPEAPYSTTFMLVSDDGERTTDAFGKLVVNIEISGMGLPRSLYFAVGLAELVGSILLFVPRLAKVGALLLIVVMAGATATHFLHREPQAITTLVVLALLCLVLYLRRAA